MKKLLLLLIIPFLSFGQGWEQIFGDGEDHFVAHSVQQVNDGGYIVCGKKWSNGAWSSDIYIMKTSEGGQEEWSQVYGGEDEDVGYSIKQTNDDGYIIAGYTTLSYNNYIENIEIYLLKLNSSGEEEWSRMFGGDKLDDWDQGYSAIQTNDGGYIITGFIQTGSPEQKNICLIKTDENGDEEWSNSFGDGLSVSGEGGGDTGYSVQQTNDGGYVVVGSTFFWGGLSQQIYLIKVDGNGNEEWSQIYGEEGSDVAYSIQQTNDGGYIIAGETYSSSSISPVYHRDVWVIKINSNGFEEWSQTYGGDGNDIGHSIQQTDDGGYIIAGETSNSVFESEADVLVIKVNANGLEEWSQTYGGDGNDIGYSIQQTNDGGYIVAGGFEGSGDNAFIYLIKLNNNGDIISTSDIEDTDNSILQKINILGQETTNKGLQLHIYDNGTVEKKYLIK
tara:strand:+ start:11845 stop:13182 length:1338 start_codon:yes stop_codon:yes gene_type:complete